LCCRLPCPVPFFVGREGWWLTKTLSEQEAVLGKLASLRENCLMSIW
jgi:hypothetical protein